MRPRGDPEAIVGAARLLAAAAAELDRVVRGLDGLGASLSAAEVWSGRASAAARARIALLDAGVGHSAEALRQAAEGASSLAGELAAAQAAWDRAASLAASAGLVLDARDPVGLLPPPTPWGDPRVPVAARAAEIARDAVERATRADRSAAARFADAAATASRVATPIGALAAGFADRGGPDPDSSAGSGPSDEGRRERPSLLARGLAVADRIGVAVGAGLEAVEARARALARLVSTGTEPAAGLAAARALATFERPALADTLVAFLPVGGPVITLAANLAEGRDRGEPLVRAVVRSLGASIGADLGQRIGIAACGAGAAATEGVGGVLCPAVAVASASIGAGIGGAEAVRIFDALGPDESRTDASGAIPRPSSNAPAPRQIPSQTAGRRP
jgi:hypothetical protein